jgi:hypothetical protein
VLDGHLPQLLNVRSNLECKSWALGKQLRTAFLKTEIRQILIAGLPEEYWSGE